MSQQKSALGAGIYAGKHLRSEWVSSRFCQPCSIQPILPTAFPNNAFTNYHMRYLKQFYRPYYMKRVYRQRSIKPLLPHVSRIAFIGCVSRNRLYQQRLQCAFTARVIWNSFAPSVFRNAFSIRVSRNRLYRPRSHVTLLPPAFSETLLSVAFHQAVFTNRVFR